MALSPAAKRLRNLAAQIPDDAAVWGVLQGLEHSENIWVDHVIAMQGAAYVDKALEVSLKAKFIRLTKEEETSIFNYENHGFLSDLSTKTKMTYTLDVIGPKTRRDLEHIRVIRNSFAHSLNPVTFETKEVSEICNLLFIPETLNLLTRWAYGSGPRAKYINAAIAIAIRLKQGIRNQTVMFDGAAFPLRLLP